MLRKIYYNLWVDAIMPAIKNDAKVSEGWKLPALFLFSIGLGFNMLTVFLIMGIFGILIDPFIDFDIFPGNKFDEGLSGFITFILPFAILNYLLIFYNSRYKKILRLYPGYSNKGRYFIGYVAISFLIFILLAIMKPYL